MKEDRFQALRDSTAAALLRSPATTPPQLRDAVSNGQPPSELAALVQKIRTRAYTVTDQDVDALRSTYTEDELFEIIVATAFGAARDRLSAALKAVEEA